MALAVLILVITRPVSFGTMVGVTVGIIVFAIVVELLRRPQPVVAEPLEDEDPEGVDFEAMEDAAGADSGVSAKGR